MTDDKRGRTLTLYRDDSTAQVRYERVKSYFFTANNTVLTISRYDAEEGDGHRLHSLAARALLLVQGSTVMTAQSPDMARRLEGQVCPHGVQRFLLCRECVEDERCECDYGMCVYCEQREETRETSP